MRKTAMKGTAKWACRPVGLGLSVAKSVFLDVVGQIKHVVSVSKLYQSFDREANSDWVIVAWIICTLSSLPHDDVLG